MRKSSREQKLILNEADSEWVCERECECECVCVRGYLISNAFFAYKFLQ